MFSLFDEAISSQNTECVQLLLSNGANINSRSFDNSTALHIAVSVDSCEMTRLLLSHGAAVDKTQDENITPVFLAAHYGRTNCLRLLIDHLQQTGCHIFACLVSLEMS